MAEEASDRTVDINYIKSADFREVACDGVIGGPTPNQKLWVAFYTERLPLPRIVRHKIVPGGQEDEFRIDADSPGTPIDSQSGIVRNVELGLYLSISVAEQLHEWLGQQLPKLKGGGST